MLAPEYGPPKSVHSDSCSPTPADRNVEIPLETRVFPPRGQALSARIAGLFPTTVSDYSPWSSRCIESETALRCLTVSTYLPSTIESLPMQLRQSRASG